MSEMGQSLLLIGSLYKKGALSALEKGALKDLVLVSDSTVYLLSLTFLSFLRPV